jgi:beta-galactosidase
MRVPSIWAPIAVILLFCVLPVPGAESAPRPQIDLNGTWEFRLDPEGRGSREGWATRAAGFEERIQVPGVWQAQGFGKPSGILRHHYTGEAWYRRVVAVPSDWAGRKVWLRVGGVVRRASVYVNGQLVGEHEGFSSPFSLDVSEAVRPGSQNVITFLVANPGEDVTESPDKQRSSQVTGMFTYIGNWGGIYGKVHLEATHPTWIDEVAIRPDVAGRRAVFQVAVNSRSGSALAQGKILVSVGRETAESPLRISSSGSIEPVEVALPLPNARLWSPEDPHLHTATIRLVENGQQRDQVEERFGMREITTRGDQLLLNGKPLYLRGYGDDNIEVLTGVPPADKEVHLKRLRVARSYGFNAVRFHSKTPIREYFQAADEAGMLVMAELPVAYTMHFLPHKEQLKREMGRILRSFRNHPSFLSLALGNEFNLNWLKSEEERKEFLNTVAEFYRYGKSIDPTRLILSNDGYVMRPTDMHSLFRDAPGDVPSVRHEFGSYYCSLPDVSLIDQFTGVIVPTWLREKKAWVERRGLSQRYPTYLLNSQRLQHFGQKYQIEAARKLPEFTGYHYWLIVDFPGGTGEGDSWEEGWLDYFWRPKVTTPEQGQELNSPVLLMINKGPGERTLWNDEQRLIEVTVSNYGERDIRGGVLSWKLHSEGKQVGEGRLQNIQAPLGKLSNIGSFRIGPDTGPDAQKLQLVVELTDGSATYTNRWDFWTFPRNSRLQSSPVAVVSDVRWHSLRRLYPFIVDADQAAEKKPAVWITSRLDSRAMEVLKSGGRVLLLADRDQFQRSGDAHFFPASGGAQGTMVRQHPALQGFPHQGYFDLQFFNLMEGGWNFAIDDFPNEFEPIAGSIRTTSSFLSKQKELSRTGYLFEANVEGGGLLVSTLAVREHLDEAYPEAVFLFDRLLRYVSGPQFKPAGSLSSEQLKRLLVR